MVQKEVKKKAQAYGLTAILLASVCVALIYYAAIPVATTNPLPQPTPTNNPSVESTSMQTFKSYDELKNFLNTNDPNNQRGPGNYGFTGGDTNGMGEQVPTAIPSAAPSQSLTSSDYSSTNIQVAGVDEADTVKTDGSYLYVVSNDTVYIMDANPSAARVLQKIPFVNSTVTGIYLSADGTKLAVLGNNYFYNSYSYGALPPSGVDVMIYPYLRTGATFACVYDVSNKNTAPVLARNVTMSGSYTNSRMIGNYIYNIVTEYAYTYNGTVLLPAVYNGAEASNIPATSVHYYDVNDSYGTGYSSYSYTTFLAINLADNAAAPTNLTIMMSGAEQVYVSQSNIYVTYPVYDWTPITFAPAPSVEASPRSDNGSATTTVVPSLPIMWRGPSTTKTTIYRIHISGDSLTFAAQGNVTGTVLNQYAMDENGSYFRVATNAYVYDSNGSSNQQNYLFVLDMNMNIVGKVENIATGESFHAARFMGNRCYLVTFNQVDPLFVVDLSQPDSPQILGNLTIPGYSDYLYPYDATHLIGVGKDVNASIDADKVHENGAVYYTAILGLKLSLFDVSDVHAPTEVSKIVIGDRNTETPAAADPHAFLFNSNTGQLVIPVNLYLANQASATSTPTPSTSDKGAPSVPLPTSVPGWAPISEPQFVWQGAFVFKVSLNGGFEVQGNVTQLSSAMLANLAQNGYYYYGGSDNSYNYFITRSVYIGNTLYTISNNAVQLNSLDNLAFLAKVELS